MKCNTLWIIASFYIGNVTTQPIDIRPATANDLPSILELDQRVTYEFFKPLLVYTYNHLGIKQNVDNDLEQELQDDVQTFPHIIQTKSTKQLHVACNTEKNILCGLLVFHKKENSEIILELLLIDKNYRNQGIGKMLVRSACKAFEGIKAVTVYPIQFNNENTLKFYESLGFKNLGVGPSDKVNSHGIPYSDIYYHFKLDIH